MLPLEKDLRNTLERIVKSARQVAETAAYAAVDQLGVGHDKPESYLSVDQKTLRNRLRTHGKQLGDERDSQSSNPTYGHQTVPHLVQEVAYQHWHRMLFARFLAENDLLMYDGVAVSLDECEELAEDEGAKSGWELAGKLAAKMLPQVFKHGSPVFELIFAPEYQSELERLLKSLSDSVFKASDSLGWVYQFWQTDSKKRINDSEVKIGADELSAVTQLFTEPYMVAFLLHNSLGAWWKTRHPNIPCPVNLEYLRTLEDGSPAAGKFEGWPSDEGLADFKLLDPCCGSGHFLVAAFLMLVPMRMVAENLSATDAVARVIGENLHGLELDPRCVEIAVFAIALEAWRYPDASGKPLGVREIPSPKIACCGLKVAASAEDWEALVPDSAPDAANLRQGLRRLHETFTLAPLLGSLLDPSKANKGDLFAADYRLLSNLLTQALATEGKSTPSSDDAGVQWELTLSAQGLLAAARLLDLRYDLVITNVPYLSRGKQEQLLKDYCESYYPTAKNDLANVFLERCLELAKAAGVVQIVMPQNWLFLGGYKKQRENLLKSVVWNLIALLGVKSFQTPMWDFNVQLLTQTKTKPKDGTLLNGIDVSLPRTAQEKADLLCMGEVKAVSQKGQLGNPDARVALEKEADLPLLSNVALGVHGTNTKDSIRFIRRFWEVWKIEREWELGQSTTSTTCFWAGCENIYYWQEGKGILYDLSKQGLAILAGGLAWGKSGVLVSQMSSLPVSLYAGKLFDQNTAAIVPIEGSTLASIWTFCESVEFNKEVRIIDQALKVTNSTLVKVPFDLAYWTQAAAEKYPNGLPKPYSNDPTQWIFHGHPQPSTAPLQVAVARLLGYTWPAETDDKMELSDEARDWIVQSNILANHADADGIVCIPAVGQEAAASDRLLNLLAAAYSDSWSNDTLAQLLSSVDHTGKSLESWLRDKLFTQHCKLFGNRPFIWHVWDGLNDGFSALVNYHKLDYKTLESLIYTYLGDWISRQKRDADNAVDGAQEKLAAAEALKKRLELILNGEAPYDIFVRWKPLAEQSIGWNPDLNDGVRMNIRPFLSVPDVGKRGAGVLRDKPNIKWEKDRGADVSSAPWYNLGLQYGGKEGDRINDHHLSLKDKRDARAQKDK